MRTVLLPFLLAASVATSAQTVRHRADFTPAERKRLDTFFTNFTEAGLPDFRAGRLTDVQMIEFADSHEWENGHVPVGRSFLKASRIISLCDRYLGMTPKSFPTRGNSRFDHKRLSYSRDTSDEDLLDGDTQPTAIFQSLKRRSGRQFAYVREGTDDYGLGEKFRGSDTFFVMEVRPAKRPSGYILISRHKISRAEFFRVTGWR